MSTEKTEAEGTHFIHEIIEQNLADATHDTIVTRFPPEPNGCLHIGHAKAICLDFGTAEKYSGKCHLRFDDTNPTKEDIQYVEAIKEDIKWLGFDWGDNLFHASSYFDALYDYATQLIAKGLAYVCTLTPEEFKAYRGAPTSPGKHSPWRDRSIEENLDLFARMKAGEFEDGSYVVRAKIDMASPNLHMRDPAIYRIKHATHHSTGDAWCIYPMYDFAHCLSDSIEGITHSLCTLEFEVHRPLYDWFLEKLEVAKPQPRQIEFARLNLTYTVMSKRKLQELVETNLVVGWDDPRMPTLSGLRRRGYTPASIRALCDKVGITKFNSLSDVGLLEACVREDLNKTSARRMAVLDPVKVVITNFPEDGEETFPAINNPEDPDAGTRPVTLTREVFIERNDFMEEPPRKYFRLAPGKEVRLKYACYITCTDVIKDDAGEIQEIHCTWDPESRGANTPDGRKVKGTIHWVSVRDALWTEVRLYDRLFNHENPDGDKETDFKEHLNADSLEVRQCPVEPSLGVFEAGDRCQFERLGYFCADKDGEAGKPVFNRTVGLRDSWAKMQKK